MLKYRVLTAALLIPLVIIFVFFVPYVYFIAAAILLLLGTAWEWCGLIGLSSKLYRMLYVLILGLLTLSAYYLLPLSVIFYLSLLFWCLGILFLASFPRGQSFWNKHLWFKLIIGAVMLIPFIDALLFIKLQQNSATWFMLILLMVWAADTGAYFSGKRWGKNKLIPQVSPNKTREGLYGGIVLSMLVILFFAVLTKNPIFLNAYFIWGLILCVIFAVAGDLIESAVKRFANVKDSGNILPGHGGLLDRLDSLIAALPIFALTLWLFS